MTTYNTGNPIGSTDARDLYDNAQNLDNFANGASASYTDRLGVSRRSLAGIDSAADNVLNSIGYSVPVAYTSGISLTLTSQTVDYNGVIYAPKSSALPFTTSSWGTDSAKFRAVQVTDADLITHTPAGTGAVATTVQSKLREFVSVLGFYANGVNGAPVDPTGVIDSTEGIQKAIDYAAAAKKRLIFPSGTYLIRTTKTGTFAGGTLNYALDIVSDMHIEAESPGTTTFKVKDGESSDASPKNYNIFFSNGQPKNISLVGVVFDMNGVNNPISPDRGSGIFNRYLCASFVISGDTAWCKNVRFDRCVFKNTPGTSVIVAAQSANGVAGPLSQNVWINDCDFLDNGIDTSDHSCVFMWAENSGCINSRFIQSASLSKTNRNWVAYEIHGSNSQFRNNYVENFYRGCWIASNFTNVARSLWVTDNTFKVWGLGPSLFRQLNTLTEVREVHIARNNIYIDNTVTALDIKAAIEMNALYTIKDISVYDNKAVANMDGVGQCAFMVMAGGAGAGSAGDHGDVLIYENEANGFQYGVFCRTYVNSGGFNYVNETNNHWKNLKVTNTSGISVGSYYTAHANKALPFVVVKNNSYQSSATARGLRFEGPITYAEVDGHTFSGMASYPSPTPLSLDYAVATLTRRVGKQLNTVSTASLPTSSTWGYGDEVYTYNPTRPRNISHWKYDGASWRAYGVGWGTTAERPTLNSTDAGYSYFDTTLAKMILWNGTSWNV